MEPGTLLIAFGLYKTSELFLNKLLDAAWKPAETELKNKFFQLAGKSNEQQRETAFKNAVVVAHNQTINTHENADSVFLAFQDNINTDAAKAFMQEALKVTLFYEEPDSEKLVEICKKRFAYMEYFGNIELQPDEDIIVKILQYFFISLREALLQQPEYSALVNQEILKELRKINALEIDYDTEEDYLLQLINLYGYLDFAGIPDLRDKKTMNIQNIFINLKVTKYQSEEKSSRSLGHSQRSSFIGNKLTNCYTAIENDKHVVILGDPGSGKTTLLKNLVILAAEKKLKNIFNTLTQKVLPIFISAKGFASEYSKRKGNYNLLDYITTSAYEKVVSLPPNFFVDALQLGRCIICIDGFDEVWSISGRQLLIQP